MKVLKILKIVHVHIYTDTHTCTHTYIYIHMFSSISYKIYIPMNGVNNAHNHATFYILFKNIKVILHEKYTKWHLVLYRIIVQEIFGENTYLYILNIFIHLKRHLIHKMRQMKIINYTDWFISFFMSSMYDTWHKYICIWFMCTR